MSRRELLALLTPVGRRREPSHRYPAPETDPVRLNTFSRRYNAYIHQLQQGIIDLARWQDAADAGARLFCGSAGDCKPPGARMG